MRSPRTDISNLPEIPGARYVPLTQGKVAIVDESDYAFITQWEWTAVRRRCGHWYAIRHASQKGGEPKRQIFMHRELMACPDGIEVDHKNGDGLDNRRSTNLRLSTRVQNGSNRKRNTNNTSGFTGVVRYNGKLPWRATICVQGRRIHLGSFSTLEQAARARDEAAIRYHGEFAKLTIQATSRETQP